MLDYRMLIKSPTCSTLTVLPHPEQASRYLPDKIQVHRDRLSARFQTSNLPYNAWDYRAFENQIYPLNLGTIDGLWRDPIPVKYNSLVVLDIDISKAIYWLLPILSAASDSPHFRRLILRDTDDFNALPFPLQVTELDLVLSDMPAVNVILLFPSEASIAYFTASLPLTNHYQRLKWIFEGPSLPNCVLAL